MVRFGIIGTSTVTEQLLAATKGIRKFQVTAVYSRDMKKAMDFGKKYGANYFYDDLEEFARSDAFDAVYIASPNSCHCEQSILMMKNKKHVLCEKPLASNAEEVNRMFETAHENGVILLEAMRSAFAPEFPRIRSYFKKLGKIRRVNFHLNQYSSKYNAFREGKIANSFQPEYSGGALMDLGCYCIYPMVFWFGLPKEVTGTCVFLENGIDGAGTVLLNYGDMIGEAGYSKITYDTTPCEIQGEKASMQISHIASTRDIMVRYPNGFKEVVHFDQRDNNMEYEVKAFIEMIEEGRSWDIYEKVSKNTAFVMEEARKKMGLVFPADKTIDKTMIEENDNMEIDVAQEETDIMKEDETNEKQE